MTPSAGRQGLPRCRGGMAQRAVDLRIRCVVRAADRCLEQCCGRCRCVVVLTHRRVIGQDARAATASVTATLAGQRALRSFVRNPHAAAAAKQVPRFEPDRLRGLKSFELATFAMSVQLKFSCEFPIAKRLHALILGQFGICT